MRNGPHSKALRESAKRQMDRQGEGNNDLKHCSINTSPIAVSREPYFIACSFGSTLWLEAGTVPRSTTSTRRSSTPVRISTRPTSKSPEVSGSLDIDVRIICTQELVQLGDQKQV
jgi:hypothetical protein